MGCTLVEVMGLLEALASVHARWWRSQNLEALPWLRLKSMAAPDAMAAVFAVAWPFFLTKLSSPMTADILGMGDWIKQALDVAAKALSSTSRVHSSITISRATIYSLTATDSSSLWWIGS